MWKKKIEELFALDIPGSILVQKYHAEFGEAVDVDHYTDISNGEKLQVTVVGDHDYSIYVAVQDVVK